MSHDNYDSNKINTVFITFSLHSSCTVLNEEECYRIMQTFRDACSEQFRILAVVVMPDHVHIILELGIGVYSSDVLKILKGRSARLMNLQRKRTGTFWLPSFHERYLIDEESIKARVWYIRRNPIKANLANARSYRALWISQEFRTIKEMQRMPI